MQKQKESKERNRGCVCPYCEEELALSAPPYCSPCNVTLLYCAKCGIVVEREAKVCPQCGGKLEGK